MNKNNYFSIVFENDRFIFLDQTKLPKEEIYIETDDYERIAEAIERLEIRGAPAIGIAAAYGLALSLSPPKSPRRGDLKKDEIFYTAYNRLARTRPTAVNLFFALDELKKIYELHHNEENIYEMLLNEAKKIHNDDRQ